MDPKVIKELRKLASLFTRVSESLEVIATQLDAPQQVERSADDEVEPPWDAIVDRALSLLRAEPERIWKPAELCRAVRDSGVAIEKMQGIHLGVMPRLKRMKVIAEVEGGFHASKLSISADSPPSDTEASPEAAEKQRRELPWAEIIPAAMRLLRAQPDRAWGQAELVRAVRDAGVALENLQGIHFGLTSRLSGLGAVDVDDDGRLRLGALASGHDPDPAPGAVRRAGPEDEVDALTEEIEACEFFLDGMTPEKRTAQVALWAGRARAVQADAALAPERRSALRRVFGRLTRITRDQQCDWVDALTPTWETDWPIYIAVLTAELAGEEPELSAEQRCAHWRARLLGLSVANRRVMRSEAEALINLASAVLPEDDEVLRTVSERFGVMRVAAARPPLIRRVTGEAPVARVEAQVPAVEAPPRTVQDAVLAVTRGKKAVILGGQGAREQHRESLQRLFEFAELEWVFSERNAGTSQFAKVEERVRNRSYDLVLFLAGYTSHKSVKVLKACKETGVPLVYLSRGYSVAQVERAIGDQRA